ncbi:vacuolar protein sorting 51 [Rhynchophorus ferrugineus]|uniref:Vacuolar protein sorting-associated protein 51 homolog n=1 Tax=Rhynchophorus ferrugineus TaxID=354439 RepID=A0A834MDG0_RHYFE|nr:hypothetical protein GWI33_006766 [Rhynchophorus ferrugineus]
MAEKNQNPLDINGPNFSPNLYLDKMFKESTLRQIMDNENEIVKDTQTLHSDMQTLVYENYNKFISATDTIRKMKNDFKKMEDEMDLLASNMESITSFSEKINSNLQDTRDKISHLSGVHSLLQRLQFLFKLPSTLKGRMKEKNYIQATQDYIHAQRVLQQYGDMPAFQGIKTDCVAILEELKTELRKQFSNPNATTKELMESVDLLLQLEEPPKELCSEFLTCAEKRLSDQLVMLKDQSEQRDIVEFVDLGCSGFLSDLCLIIASFHDMFINRMNIDNTENSEIFENFAAVELEIFVKENMQKYFDLIQSKVDSEQDIADTNTLVQALDRFYMRIEGNTFSKNINFTTMATDIINNAGTKQCKAHLHILKLAFTDTLTKVRQTLTTPKLISQDDSSKNLTELLNSMIVTVVEKTKGVLQDLVAFISPEITFAKKTHFRECFCVDNVREGLVVCFLHHLTSSIKSICSEGILDSKIPPTLILLLSKFCLDFRNGSVRFLLSETDEVFHINQKRHGNAVTNESEIINSMQETAQYLLNYYVRLQGYNCSQMLRKSVETRDWLHTIEPRTVRAVMKRVVEDISAIDATVALLYEDQGTATDENLVHFLLDEILGSAVHRCLEPVLMEPGVVDIICERG